MKVAFALLLLALKGDAVRRDGICSWLVRNEGDCFRNEFRCFDGTCINRDLYCNGISNCEDNSDEEYCGYRYECPSGLRKCGWTNKCISVEWFCDGIQDCLEGLDEICDGSEFSELSARHRALRWLETLRVYQAPTNVWGSSVDKTAVAFYLGNSTWGKEDEVTRREMAYELSIQLRSRLSKKKLEDIPSNDLASYVNAFLVTCLNPRNFHGLDIVQELRNRVDRENYTNPYVILSLCNSGETITLSDKRKLIDAFQHKRRALWTDVRALAIMAYACANEQTSDVENLLDLAEEFKKQLDGTTESLQTAALVMQALISVDPYLDSDDFDVRGTFQKIKAKQSSNGSFGNFMNTYYVLPVLSCQSLVNINPHHCESYYKNETFTYEDLAKSSEPQIKVHYSVWIENDSDLERNLALKVPANVSFYKVMQMAADFENQYRFEYMMQDDKPYVYTLYGKQDDPEKGKFWFLYTVKEGVPVVIEKSPVDVIPEDDEHFILWYRDGIWVN